MSQALQQDVATDIREQRVIGAAGAEEVRRSVFCGMRGHSVDLASCTDCSRRVRLESDPIGKRSRLLCRIPVPDGEVEQGSVLGLEAPVAEVMSTKVICVRSELSVRSVLMVLVEQGIGGAPVVDGSGRPVGFISMTDLLREQYDQIDEADDELLPPIARDAIAQHHGGMPHPLALASVTAAEVMTPSLFALNERASVQDAIVKMSQHRVQRVPVVSEDGRMVGIVSMIDVIDHLAAALE